MQEEDPSGPGPAAASPLATRVQARLAEQDRVVRRLLDSGELLPGTVFERWSTCSKPGCACASGRRHGPYYVLAVGSGEGRAWTSLGAEGLEEARRLVRRHREFRKGLNRLAALQRALGALLRKHGEQAARRTVRRLDSARRARR